MKRNPRKIEFLYNALAGIKSPRDDSKENRILSDLINDKKSVKKVQGFSTVKIVICLINVCSLCCCNYVLRNAHGIIKFIIYYKLMI